LLSSDINLLGKWVVITGCDSGFGLKAVKQLSARGASVIAVCFTPEGAGKAIECGAAQTLVCDLTNEPSISQIGSRISDICKGVLWAVVHNAGVVQGGFIDFTTTSAFRRAMDINFFAHVSLNQCLMPLIKRAGSLSPGEKSRIVFVSSMSGIVPVVGLAPYSTSKHALEGFAETMRVEASLWNVHVAILNPAFMRTPILGKGKDSCRASWEEMCRTDPDGRWRREYTKDWLEKYLEKFEKSCSPHAFASMLSLPMPLTYPLRRCSCIALSPNNPPTLPPHAPAPSLPPPLPLIRALSPRSRPLTALASAQT
jgi:NAD(P)-dependent dehydrogenase (short-subunit alcohol dehydrogenase family)